MTINNILPGDFVCIYRVLVYSAMMQYPCDAHWSTTRPSVMYVAKMDGSIDVWDFLFLCRKPTLNVMVHIRRRASIGRVSYIRISLCYFCFR